MVRPLSYVNAKMSAEPMRFGCEHLADSGLGARLAAIEAARRG